MSSGKRVAEVISFLLMPHIIALYVLVYMIILDWNLVGFLLDIVFLILAPFLIILVYSKLRELDLYISERKERYVPYALTLMCHVFGLVALACFNQYNQYYILTLSYFVVTIVLALITFWWKISGHAAGVSIPLTFSIFIVRSMPLSMILLIMLIINGWSRIKLKAHSPGQYIAGVLLPPVILFLTYTLLRNI